MKTFRQYAAVFLFLLLLMSGISACAGKQNDPAKIAPTPSPSVVPDADGDGKIETRELLIDTIDVTTNEVVAATAYTPADEQITPQVIVREVVESLYNNGILIQPEEVFVEEDRVIISFSANADGLAFQEDEQLETAVLDSLSYSILDNLNEINGIIFRIGGEGYVSEAFQLEAEEEYTWR